MLKKHLFVVWMCLVCVSAYSGASDCTPLAFSQDFKEYTGSDFSSIVISGETSWYFNQYGANANGYNKSGEQECWLLSPEFDLDGLDAVQLTVKHNIYYNNDNNYEQNQTLLVTNHYTGDVTTTTWTPVRLTYQVKGWESATVSIPAACLTDGFRFAFHYYGAGESSNYWEIASVELNGTCIGGGNPLPSMPLARPQVGGRLVVCGNNLRNYFTENLDEERPDYHDAEGLADKTRKIVNTFRFLQADIYAVCEVEVAGQSMKYLTDALNEAEGRNVYSYLNDNLTFNETWGIKVGYIYRNDKVELYRSYYSSMTSSTGYYVNNLRYQAFKEKASGEVFVLSMNHFKAKDSSADQGESTRLTNASNVINALSRMQQIDPDILLMGDLNCTIEEQPMQNLVNAGLQEQLLRFDANAYSYQYRGNQQLIDHAMANASMAGYVTKAEVYHINTGFSGNTYWYSDHDPYLVGVNLPNGTPVPVPDPDEDITEGWANSTVTTRPVKTFVPGGGVVVSVGDATYNMFGLRIK